MSTVTGHMKSLKFYIAGPSCNDGFKNGNETDVDCGGPCRPCGDGLKCNSGSDCASVICTLNICQGECSYVQYEECELIYCSPHLR